MKRILRRTSLVLFVVLPPLFAWGCGPAPTWRRFLGETYQNWISPDDSEVLAIMPESSDGSRDCSLLDAKTGATKRPFRLAPDHELRRLLPGGAILTCSRKDGEFFLFDADDSRSPRRFPRPEGAGELFDSFDDAGHRWLAVKYRGTDDGGKRTLTIVVHDLAMESPAKIYRGFGDATFLADGRRIVMREGLAENLIGVGLGKLTKYVCMDLFTGGRVWEARVPDEYILRESSPARHWVAFFKTWGVNNAQLPEWIVLDDRTGKRAAEWDESVQGVSTGGLVAESAPGSSVATVRGEGFARTFDLGGPSTDRRIGLAESVHGRRRLVVEDHTTMFNFSSLGVKTAFGYKSIERIRNREWNVDTCELLVSEVQYQPCNNVCFRIGNTSGDGSFDIQTCSLFGLRWLQRVERPTRKSVPLRIAVGVAPVLLLAAFRLRAGRKEKSPGREALALKEAPA